MRTLRRLALCCAFSALAIAAPAQAAPTYTVQNVRTQADRARVARTGAAIVDVDHAMVTVTASRSDLRALRRAGLKVVRTAHKSDFPAADAAYHNYTEMSTQVMNVANAYPSIVSRFSVGFSYENRQLWAVKVSDNVGADEAEPEVLFTCGQHAREHLTIEMCLYLLDELTSK
jgi:carboxypeptidase T